MPVTACKTLGRISYAVGPFQPSATTSVLLRLSVFTSGRQEVVISAPAAEKLFAWRDRLPQRVAITEWAQ
jgi:hypothetical protein